MKGSRYSIVFVAAMFALLGVLAVLQYAWLGQISDGERERLRARLQADTRRFAEDFNREIENVFFNFQVPHHLISNQDRNEFNERYDFWAGRTPYPKLIKNFYFVEFEGGKVTRYDFAGRSFEAIDLPENLRILEPNFRAETNHQTIYDEIPVLIVPIYEVKESIQRVVVRTPNTEEIKGVPEMMPKKSGVLIVGLDEKVITDQVIPDLAKRYFSESEGANYNLAVINRAGQTVFQTNNLTSTDATVKLFNLSQENFIFYGNRNLLPQPNGDQKSLILSTTSRLETRTVTTKPPANSNGRVEFKLMTEEITDAKPRVRIFDANLESKGAWTLNVQHTSGSLENFITGTRHKNLIISFGILSLLGGSVLLIFLSAHRAKLFAQRQVDFVSSVSHEFRTPLAVIYSASENLADGVTREREQIVRYGNLIKGEGKKLTAMVEQILEFAGARSGKKQYDRRETDISEIIENALSECQPLIEEKGFTVEKDIAEDLPKTVADKNALTQAVQNLITNSLKYSNGERWLKISAKNGGGKIKISVEDHGIGIASKDLKHIFEPFYRAKAVVDEQIHGNGLGLSLVKETIEAHGGKIRAESEPGKGSKFTIEIMTAAVRP